MAFPSAKNFAVEGGGDPKDASEMLNDPEMMKAQGIPCWRATNQKPIVNGDLPGTPNQ